ncbi:MAG: MBL fold metallo-hydrolase [Spirochaetales bacterium]|uniref:MBL fold metallo-hydrolase n=1 Tax=Candidatus Thalassospirochaeta sargassi TaxID=3119039 RepID=A0AAJ1MM51_9SPIO|nr:MBL fold metallo-hydrolase [Spirochaetales bacterium]
MKAKLIFLMDDKPGDGLLNEHGLSILVETGDSRILFDTGQSSAFSVNAERLNIDLLNLDLAVISHGHYDHGGGLPAFFDKNSETPVYIHKKAPLQVYYSTSKSDKPRFVGIKEDIFTADNDRFIYLDSMLTPAEGIHIIPCTNVPGRGPIFDDNSLFLLNGKEKSAETFDHEIFMVIEREKDILVISGCSHNNISSIISYAVSLFPGKKLTAVIGGFHMPDIRDFSEHHAEAVNSTAEKLLEISKKSGPTSFFTGHCTGDKAKLLLSQKMGSNIDFFSTGLEILL